MSFIMLKSHCERIGIPFRNIHILRHINHMKTSLLNHTHKNTIIPLHIKYRVNTFQVEEQHMENIVDINYDSNLLHMSDASDVGQEYNDAMKRLCIIEKKMLEPYPEIKDVFDEYQSATIDLACPSNRHEFAKGMRAGAQIILEIIKPL